MFPVHTLHERIIYRCVFVPADPLKMIAIPEFGQDFIAFTVVHNLKSVREALTSAFYVASHKCRFDFEQLNPPVFPNGLWQFREQRQK